MHQACIYKAVWPDDPTRPRVEFNKSFSFESCTLLHLGVGVALQLWMYSGKC
jgi:hypothetical protein